jgi:hypothetical protein
MYIYFGKAGKQSMENFIISFNKRITSLLNISAGILFFLAIALFLMQFVQILGKLIKTQEPAIGPDSEPV